MRILPAVLALSALASPAGAATRNFGITGFEKVRIEGPYRIVLSTGVAPFARATGSAAALDKVAIEVRGNTLVVHNSRSSWGGFSSANSGPVEIALGTHDLRSVSLNGSGTIAIDRVKGLSFDLSVHGSGGRRASARSTSISSASTSAERPARHWPAKRRK